MKVVKLKSPAKVNLRLDVLQKRSDGYHDLRMLNSPVSLYDELECTLVEKGIAVEVENDNHVPPGEENIVYKVAKEILAYSNKNVGVHIKIQKNIPSAAGMGGGSSNAASVLMGLNELLRINLSREKLMKIGVRFGADVPFFLLEATAIARGVGDELFKVKKMPKLPMVLISPNIKVPTKWVFEKYAASNDNAIGARPSPPQEELPVQYMTKRSVIRHLHNDLETVTIAKYPFLNDIKRLLTKMGALACQMTGSGPTVFGIFPTPEAAVEACGKLNTTISDCKVFCVQNLC